MINIQIEDKKRDCTLHNLILSKIYFYLFCYFCFCERYISLRTLYMFYIRLTTLSFRLFLIYFLFIFRQKDGVRKGDVFISYKSIGQDVRMAMDWLHDSVSKHFLLYFIFLCYIIGTLHILKILLKNQIFKILKSKMLCLSCSLETFSDLCH